MLGLIQFKEKKGGGGKNETKGQKARKPTTQSDQNQGKAAAGNRKTERNFPTTLRPQMQKMHMHISTFFLLYVQSAYLSPLSPFLLSKRAIFFFPQSLVCHDRQGTFARVRGANVYSHVFNNPISCLLLCKEGTKRGKTCGSPSSQAMFSLVQPNIKPPLIPVKSETRAKCTVMCCVGCRNQDIRVKGA